MEQVTITRSQDLVLRYQRTSFRKALERFDLFFEAADKLVGFFGAVLRNKGPGFFDIPLRRACDSNAKTLRACLNCFRKERIGRVRPAATSFSPTARSLAMLPALWDESGFIEKVPAVYGK
jgi:hypothetical protein